MEVTPWPAEAPAGRFVPVIPSSKLINVPNSGVGLAGPELGVPTSREALSGEAANNATPAATVESRRIPAVDLRIVVRAVRRSLIRPPVLLWRVWRPPGS